MSYFADTIKNAIRTVPDWPKPGVQFRDITTVLQDRTTFRKLVDAFVHRYHGLEIDAVAAVDARGFIIGSALAYELNAGLVLVRKKGKLPFHSLVEDYELEYGTASVELHEDAFKPGDRVVLVDDLIATGGTMLAAARLIRRVGADIVEVAAMIDLPDLGGSARLRSEDLNVFTVCSFEGD
jgi:adenine phosphoribosyltransferase